MSSLIQLLQAALPELIGGLAAAAIIALLGFLYRRWRRRRGEEPAPDKDDTAQPGRTRVGDVSGQVAIGDDITQTQHTVFDQRDQQVDTQYNVAGDFIQVPHPEPPVQSTVDISSRLEEFGLGDKSEEKFGTSEYTADLAFHGGPHYVILAAIPLDKVAHSSTRVLGIAKTMLNPENWWAKSRSEQGHPPKYWPFSIFDVPISRHFHRNAFIWEDPGNQGESVLSRLVITGLAEVLFVSAYAFVTALDSRKGERIPIFGLGPILAECWKLSGLVAQLYQEIEYSGRTQLCVGMVNTKGSHLGGFATPWVEPDSPRYWHDVWLLGLDWSCHSLHLRFCETANLLEMEPKKQPEFIREFGEAISLAYNHDEPRCFEKETGLIPSRYFKRGSF